MCPTVLLCALCCVTAEPIPQEAALAQARETLRAVFAEELEAADSAEQKSALARKLLATVEGSSPAERYVLLVAARRLAVAADDPEVGIDACRGLAAFQGPAMAAEGHQAWNASKGLRDRLAAAEIYLRALPDLSGFQRAAVEGRLKDLGGDDFTPSGQPPLAVAPFDAKQAKVLQRQWARHLKLPAETTNSIGMKLVLIPPGKFQMGTPEAMVKQLVADVQAKGEAPWTIGSYQSEAPQQEKKIEKAFYAGVTEVTRGQWARLAGQRPGADAPLPVTGLTAGEAAEFCRRLSEEPQEKGAEYTLPSATEWEYACRAGTEGLFCWGDDLRLLPRFAWLCDNAQGRVQPVGRLAPNQWGLYDVHGNALEWCRDGLSAELPFTRGGSVQFGADKWKFARCANRFTFEGDKSRADIGFRVIRRLAEHGAD